MTTDDIDFKPITKGEFTIKSALEKNKIQSGISTYEFDYPSDDSYNTNTESSGLLSVSNEVFRSELNPTRFQTLTYFTWTRMPAIHLTDTVGTFLSDGMHILEDKSNYISKSETAFIAWDGSSRVISNPIVRDPNSKGIAAKVNLGASDAPHYMSQGYILTHAKFSDESSSNKTGTISGLYQHYLFKFGDLSFDDKGKPSISVSKGKFQIKNTNFKGRLPIYI